MDKIKYSLSIILICFAFVWPAVNARSFSETEDALHVTESLETNMTTMRSDDFYDCFQHSGDCAECVLAYKCGYCAESGACVTDTSFSCSGTMHYFTCSTPNLTLIYVGVTIACIILLICKGILLYCIFARRRRVKNGMIVGQRNPLFGRSGESVMQVPQRNQEPSRPAAVHSTFKENANQSELQKF